MTISAHDSRLAGVSWRKSRHSNSQGNCVELARLAGGEVAMRNSRFPDGPVQLYTRAQMRVLIDGVKQGGFDYLLQQGCRLRTPLAQGRRYF